METKLLHIAELRKPRVHAAWVVPVPPIARLSTGAAAAPFLPTTPLLFVYSRCKRRIPPEDALAGYTDFPRVTRGSPSTTVVVRLLSLLPLSSST